MTVTAEDREAGPFNGNDVATSFAFEFKVFEDTDLRVVETVGAVESVLTLGSDYSVTLNADQDDDPGGSVSYMVAGVVTALPAGRSLTIDSRVPRTQSLDLSASGMPKSIEEALDKLTILAQELYRYALRVMLQPLSDSEPIGELPTAASRANKYLAFDADGDPIAVEATDGRITLIIPLSDTITPLVAGTAKETLHLLAFGLTDVQVAAELSTPQTSGALVTVDINESGVSILSTKLTIDNGEETSLAAATPAVVSDTTLALGSKLTFDLDGVGDGTALGLKVHLSGYPA